MLFMFQALGTAECSSLILRGDILGRYALAELLNHKMTGLQKDHMQVIWHQGFQVRDGEALMDMLSSHWLSP